MSQLKLHYRLLQRCRTCDQLKAFFLPIHVHGQNVTALWSLAPQAEFIVTLPGSLGGGINSYSTEQW
jgi:hypothetical protein